MTTLHPLHNPTHGGSVRFQGKRRQPLLLKPAREHTSVLSTNKQSHWLKAGLATVGLVLVGLIGCAPSTPSKPEDPAQQTEPAAPPAPKTGPKAEATQAFSLESIAAQLESPEGLTGLVHGSDPQRNLFVLTVHEKGNVLNSFHFPLIPQNDEAEKLLKSIERHDTVNIKGRMVTKFGTPQRHIEVDSIQVVENWEPTFKVGQAKPWQYQTELPKDLLNKESFTGLVHAVLEDGAILVMEYKDRIVPVVVPNNKESKSLTKDLWRGDIATIRYKVKRHPNMPTHLVLDARTGEDMKPVHVVNQLNKLDGKKLTISGNLVVFPKSPVLNQNTWAIEQIGPEGIPRYFTLANFEDTEEHKKIVAKLESFWNSRDQGKVDGRNKFIHTGVQVEATGNVLVLMANQANPTIELHAENLKLVERK